MKVLVPLAMPSVFNSLRLLFGLAFGYIMLAEVVKFGGESGGLGDIINTSQRRGPREHMLLVLLIIPVVALVIDHVLLWIQRELFPYRYGGSGHPPQAGARGHARLGRPEGTRLAAGHPRGSSGRARSEARRVSSPGPTDPMNRIRRRIRAGRLRGRPRGPDRRHGPGARPREAARGGFAARTSSSSAA